jgi:iron complex outermembrane receptor protein
MSADNQDLSLEDLLNTSSELKADVGSRTGAKNFLNARSPVDVITYEQIERSGYTTLPDVLRYFVAGFNAPESAINDGSDHVRGFTLRGMGSDQILVLVNGKRLHTSALLHVNSTVARGSSNVDLDSIAINDIEKVEILRDGAAAQYGSDAISGVINVILKGAGHDNAVNVQGGMRKKGDGEKVYVDYFGSKSLPYDGYVNFALSAQNQESTQRAGNDPRISPREKKTQDGIPEAQNLKLMINADAPQEQGYDLYSKIQLNYRESESGAFFRPKNHNPVTASKYPNGFLPMIQADILDYSVLLGSRGRLDNRINWDLSNSYGSNQISYGVDNSMNYALGADSPSDFKNGDLIFTQNTTNLDLTKSLGDFDVSGGLEYRVENYQIEAGEKASYFQNGSQGFAGYHPDNEIDALRQSQAAYSDLVYHATDTWDLEGALRFENFSDFGTTTNYKLSTGYYPIPEVLLRSSYSTGFRAPSLAQSSFSQTSTFISGSGGLSTSGTFIPDHKVSKALGATALTPELSEHFTIGGVFQPTTKTSLMLDYFYTQVTNRIMLSGNLTGANAQQKAVLAANNVTSARFFTNAVDTETQGIDVKLNHAMTIQQSDDWKSGIWFNYSKNKITALNSDVITRDNSMTEMVRIENGQPQTALRFLNSYQIGDVTTTLNVTRQGSYQQVISNKAYDFDPRWLVDLDLALNFTKNMLFSIGAHNLLDSYPNEWKNLTGNNFYGQDGILQYSRYSPYGYSGSYYYANVNVKF